MSRASFFDLVINLRYNQHMYYKTRDRGYARHASDIELKVYKELEAGQAWLENNKDFANQQGSRFSFFLLVKKMCENQRQWYFSRDRQFLLASCELEKRVDAEIPKEYAKLNIADEKYIRYIQELQTPHC